MNEVCSNCGEPLTAGLCITCDVDEIEALEASGEGSAEPLDPLIGSIIADRYEVLKLQGVGGMARVYRALQRSLDREVVIKVISPELLAEDEFTADEAVARFMVEAQAASKLNHPNVVSVFDFGRTPSAAGGLLFMVMEFLSGSDLRTVHRAEPEMPFARIASILQQTLAALAEAHFLGIAHRDVKPENIIIEPTRQRRDLVKVIDFGLARIGALQTVTRVGQTVGTPHYMAPEQIAGEALGSGDLYSVAVMMFELLTGQVPFDGDTPISILRQHLEAPRPDPRDVAPHRDIPPALAGVCMRAMHVHPEQRWPDAESFSAAITRAAGALDLGRASIPEIGEWPPVSARATMPPAAPLAPARPSRPPPPAAPASISSPRTPPRPRTAERPETAASAPLQGREADLAWASAILAGGGAGRNLGLHGAPGTGRSRVLGAIADAAEARGLHVLRVRAAAAPRGEVSLGAARHLVRALAAIDADDPGLRSGAAAGRDASAATGLRAIFSGVRPADADGSRACATAALVWAAKRAVEQAGGASVLLAVDDADILDNASRTALLDALAQKPAAKLFTLTTSEAPLPLPRERSDQRELRGLSSADAARLLQWLGGAPEGIKARGAGAEVEPLYVEFLRRFRLDGSPSRAPANLLELAETGLAMLAPAQRRLMLVAALIGGGSRGDLGAVGRPEDVGRALDPLLAAGLLEATRDGGVRVAHALFGRVALALAPGAAVADLHVAAAAWLASEPGSSEMRAYHAVRGHPDFETFMLVEDCAAQRSALGDHDGAIEVLRSGLRSGQTLLQHGDVEAGGSACVVFGQKLGATLRGLDRCEDAITLLEESLQAIPPGDLARVGILEELARAAGSLGKLGESETWRKEALTIARRLGAKDLVQRLVAMTRE